MTIKSSKKLINGHKLSIQLMLIYLGLMYLPEAITWLTMPDDLIFNGTFINITDFNVYLSAIRQGAEGSWLFNPQFTPETFPPYLSFLPYMLIGKLMAVIGGSVLVWFQVLRILSLALAFAALQEMVKTTFPQDSRLQKTSMVLLTLSSGIGWLMLPIFKEITLYTPDLFKPEWNLITASFAAPHFLLGIALQAAFFNSFSKLARNFAWQPAAHFSIIGIGISLVYPYQIVVNGLVLAAYFLVQTFQTRKLPWQEILLTGSASLPMIAALGYYGFILPRDPIYKEVIVTNNEILAPPLGGIVIGFGILGLLALLGMRQSWRDRLAMLIIVWLPINLATIYLPLSFSGRFLTGLFIPLGLVAAYGLEKVALPRLQTMVNVNPDRARSIILTLTVPSTIMFVAYFFLVINSFSIFPYYNRIEDDLAARWLGEHTKEEDLVMAEFPVNNLLPRYGKGRVFNGHFDLTVDLEGRFKINETFWSPETPDSWRQNFIEEWGFTYLYQGFNENVHNNGLPLEFPYQVIYQTGEVTIYRLP